MSLRLSSQGRGHGEWAGRNCRAGGGICLTGPSFGLTPDEHSFELIGFSKVTALARRLLTPACRPARRVSRLGGRMDAAAPAVLDFIAPPRDAATSPDPRAEAESFSAHLDAEREASEAPVTSSKPKARTELNAGRECADRACCRRRAGDAAANRSEHLPAAAIDRERAGDARSGDACSASSDHPSAANRSAKRCTRDRARNRCAERGAACPRASASRGETSAAKGRSSGDFGHARNSNGSEVRANRGDAAG